MNKSKSLFEKISHVYNSQELQKIPGLRALLLEACGKMDDGREYEEVIWVLYHGISDYYIRNQSLPAGVKEIYRFITPDVKAQQLRDEQLRRMELAKSLMAFPVMFNGLIR